MVAFLHYPSVHGAISGLLAAVVVDLHAFISFKTIQEAAAFQWRTALFRYAQGLVSGGLVGAGLGAL